MLCIDITTNDLCNYLYHSSVFYLHCTLYISISISFPIAYMDRTVCMNVCLEILKESSTSNQTH